MATNGSFQRVYDNRNRRVRGLWQRNGTFYAQMRVPGHQSPVKLPLQDAPTVPQAVTAMQVLKARKQGGALVVQKSKGIPTFAELSGEYLREMRALKSKKDGTIKREASGISKLQDFLGGRPANKIQMKDAFAYATWRMEGEEAVGGRAVDVDIITLRHVMSKAVRDGHLHANPIGEWKALADEPDQLRLPTNEEIDAMCEAAAQLQHGQRFADYLKLLKLCGGREQEVLALRWDVSVDWEREQLGFGQGDTADVVKFSKPRWIPMGPDLKAHLGEMEKRKHPKSAWLFPSRMSAGKVRTGSYKKARMIVAEKCGIQEFGFHHLRHFFTTKALESGIDVKTLAGWLGHNDGGALLLRKYAHLIDAHSKNMAKKLSFDPKPNEEKVEVPRALADQLLALLQQAKKE
jgi:integrase